MINMTTLTLKSPRAMLCTSLTVLLAACGGGSGSDTAQSDAQTSDPAYLASANANPDSKGYKDSKGSLSPATTTSATTTTSPTTTASTTTTTTATAVGPTNTTFTPSGPITLSSGQTVTGLQITNPNGPCIQGSGVSDVHIYNNKIGPCGAGSNGVGVHIENNAHDIKIDHNSFDDVSSAFIARNSTNNLVFEHNYASRVRGPMPGGQLVLLDKVNGSGNRITCNVSDQTLPAGTEDHINPWASSGTAASPILIQYNKLRGGGPSNSGGGTMLGDGGSSYITADTNILVNPGMYGIAIAGGHNNKLLNNKVYSATQPWTGVGAYVWKWLESEPASYSHEVSGNRVNWTDKSGVVSNWWDGGNSGPITMSNNVFGDSSIGADIWNETFPQCGG